MCRDAHLLEPDVLRPRPATDRHQELPRPDLTLLGVDADAVARLLGALDLDPDPAVDARLLERAEHLLRDVLILQRHQPVQALQQGHLDPELVVERGELDADSARADDADRLGHPIRQGRVVGRDDEPAVELDAGQCLDVGAGRDDEVLRFESLCPHLDGVPVAQAPAALHDLDLVLLHQELDALVQLVHHPVPPRRDGLVVVGDLVGVDAEFLATGGDAVEQLRGLEQDLGRDAADVQAGASELVGLNERHLQAELGGANRRRIAAHAATQDHEVEVVIH